MKWACWIKLQVIKSQVHRVYSNPENIFYNLHIYPYIYTHENLHTYTFNNTCTNEMAKFHPLFCFPPCLLKVCFFNGITNSWGLFYGSNLFEICSHWKSVMRKNSLNSKRFEHPSVMFRNTILAHYKKFKFS